MKEIITIFYFSFVLIFKTVIAVDPYEIDCNNLRLGQYICPHPDEDVIDPKTQQLKGCTKEGTAKGKIQ